MKRNLLIVLLSLVFSATCNADTDERVWKYVLSSMEKKCDVYRFSESIVFSKIEIKSGVTKSVALYDLQGDKFPEIVKDFDTVISFGKDDSERSEWTYMAFDKPISFYNLDTQSAKKLDNIIVQIKKLIASGKLEAKPKSNHKFTPISTDWNLK